MRQVVALTCIGLMSVPRRWGVVMVLILGMASVSLVSSALMAMAAGYQHAFAQAADPQRVLLLRSGAQTENQSNLNRELIPAFLDMPGIARNPASGKPMAIAEKVLSVGLPSPDDPDGAYENIVMRGTSHAALALRPEVRLLRGRMFDPGKRELVVGQAVANRYPEIGFGKEVILDDVPWQIVGLFDANGAAYESEVWADAELAISSYSITGLYTLIAVRLESPDTLETLAAAVAADARFEHQLWRERDFYGVKSDALTRSMRVLGYTVSAIMSLGVLFSAATVAAVVVQRRTREMGTVRALGFQPFASASAILIELLLLSAVGGLLGVLAAWAVFDGRTLSTLAAGLSQLNFSFRVTAEMAAGATVVSAGLGFIGGLLPSIRGARHLIVEALAGAS